VGPTIRSASLSDYPEFTQSVAFDPSKMRQGLDRGALASGSQTFSRCIPEFLQAFVSTNRL
jgi:hypothetical protein